MPATRMFTCNSAGCRCCQTDYCISTYDRGAILTVRVSQYWASLESCLTELDLHTPQKVEADANAISALSQLTALQTLIIRGLQQSEGSVRLSFPQLTNLYCGAVDVPALVLDCPKLASLDMEEIHIDKISGLGTSLQVRLGDLPLVPLASPC